MSRVAVIGSCITRDLWPIRGDLSGLLYVSRTSLPSLFSSPVKNFRPHAATPTELTRYQHRAVVADLQKTALAELVAFRPTHLIFDFIDERFDLLSARGALATDSWELEASGYLSAPALRSARPIARLSPGCERLWSDAAAEFAALVRATPLKDARLILHSARWAEQSREANGRLRPLPPAEILPGRPAEIIEHNRLLESYEAEFLRLMPPMTLVAAPAGRLADEGHRWGLSPFHYVPEYYQAIWRELEALGVQPVVSPGDGGPSARAA